MYDKLIFINYSGGMGGEFMGWNISNLANKIKSSVYTNTFSNRYQFNDNAHLLFYDGYKHYFQMVFSNHTDIDQYFLEDVYFGNEEFFKKFKLTRPYAYNRVKNTYSTFIFDNDKNVEINNLISFYSNDVLRYFKIVDKFNLKYVFEVAHYPNNNKYNINLTDLFVGSKKINFYSNIKYKNYFMFLNAIKTVQWQKQALGIVNRSDLERYIPFVIGNAENYQFIEGYFDSDLNIDIGEVYFNNLNIDNQLSSFIGEQINLDYLSINDYVQKNIFMLKDKLDFDFNKDYDKQTIGRMIKDYMLSTNGPFYA